MSITETQRGKQSPAVVAPISDEKRGASQKLENAAARLENAINQAYRDAEAKTGTELLRAANISPKLQGEHTELYDRAFEAAAALKRIETTPFASMRNTAIAHLKRVPGRTAESLARACGYNITGYDKSENTEGRRFIDWLVEVERLRVVKQNGRSQAKLYLPEQ